MVRWLSGIAGMDARCLDQFEFPQARDGNEHCRSFLPGAAMCN